jgi:hypothetical protein
MYNISLKDELLSETRRSFGSEAAMTLDDINNEIQQARKARKAAV